MKTNIATTPVGKLAYMISVVDPRASNPKDRETWLHFDGSRTEEFSSRHEPYVSQMHVSEARYEAEEYMRALSAAKFNQPSVFNITGFLHRKMCLIGRIDAATGNGMHISFHSGVKLRLWRVMICADNMLRLKEATGYEVELEWIKPEPPEVVLSVVENADVETS